MLVTYNQKISAKVTFICAYSMEVLIMNRKAMAKETLKILEQGYYDVTVKNEAEQKLEKRQIIIKEDIKQSIEKSKLISPVEGEKIIEKYHVHTNCSKPETRVGH